MKTSTPWVLASLELALMPLLQQRFLSLQHFLSSHFPSWVFPLSSAFDVPWLSGMLPRRPALTNEQLMLWMAELSNPRVSACFSDPLFCRLQSPTQDTYLMRRLWLCNCRLLRLSYCGRCILRGQNGHYCDRKSCVCASLWVSQPCENTKKTFEASFTRLLS